MLDESELSNYDELYSEPRPRTRADCKDGPRPCPWVGCRHHLYLEVKGGQIRLNFPDFDPSELQDSCSLDIADRGESTLVDIATMLNVTKQAIKITELKAIRKVRSNAIDDLRK